jgi:hypothetical protein
MTHVTISDHNSIDGALEIAHLSNIFIGEQVTTYFPEDGCKVHVLALNIDEAQHAEIQKLRTKIYDLARYLYDQNIIAIVVLQLYAIKDRLTMAHFEQMLLLFQNFELNGARNDRENQYLKAVLQSLTSNQFEELSEVILLRRFWRKQKSEFKKAIVLPPKVTILKGC